MKRLAIIDDEADARQALRSLLELFCPQVSVCGEAAGVASAYALLRQTQPDGILLDISLEDGTGFDLLDRFPQADFQVIFTTAHDEFALKAFRYHAMDYLLKPINPEELAQAVDRITTRPAADLQQQLHHLLESTRSRQFDKIALHSLEGMIFLQLDQIVHLESDGSYTTFHLLNKERHLVARPLKDFEELLPPDEFFRLHQSHLVRIPFVKKILREEGGYAVMEDDCKIPIARRRKSDFMDRVRQWFAH